jgi:hypothetical protein
LEAIYGSSYFCLILIGIIGDVRKEHRNGSNLLCWKWRRIDRRAEIGGGEDILEIGTRANKSKYLHIQK